MARSTLITQATLVDPYRRTQTIEDILLVDGKIAARESLGVIPTNKATVTFNAKGLWILPGLIDLHVHLREPGHEHKETLLTGTQAAVAGGFTSVACMANTDPVNDCAEITHFIKAQARLHAKCKVFPIGAVSKGLKGEELAEIGGMVQAGACAISDDGRPVMNSELMRRAMVYAKQFGVPVISHAEDDHLSCCGVMNESPTSQKLGLAGNPSASEEIMVAREISLARLTGSRVHIAHISTARAVEMVRAAKNEGLAITAEVTPHHLVFSDSSLESWDSNFKMAPPLRSTSDIEALRVGLADGTIDAIATDHAPHSRLEKDRELDQTANGVIGLEFAAAATLGMVSPLRWVEALSLAPARFLGVPLGTLEVGRDADLTLFDPKLTWSPTIADLMSKSANTPFLGNTFNGRVLKTWVEGHLVYEYTGHTRS